MTSEASHAEGGEGLVIIPVEGRRVIDTYRGPKASHHRVVHEQTAEGIRLNRRRVELGLSLVPCARGLGVSPRELSDLENGRAVTDWGDVFQRLEELGKEIG